MARNSVADPDDAFPDPTFLNVFLYLDLNKFTNNFLLRIFCVVTIVLKFSFFLLKTHKGGNYKNQCK
jgi:hypothetical protein